MSELDKAMIEHINYIVREEKRPFCYRDFLNFEVNEMPYSMKHTTFRNKMLDLRKEKIVEVHSSSKPAFYTLKGIRFTDTMTDNHTEVYYNNKYSRIHTHPLYKRIKDLPLGQRSIHDIHMRFSLKGIWQLFHQSHKYMEDNHSKDIRLANIDELNIDVKITVHHTDTVTIIAGCSYFPVTLDSYGINRFTNVLTIVRERISFAIKQIAESIGCAKDVIIPKIEEWIITMWHFGADSQTEYKGEKFHESWETSHHILFTIYSKEWSKGKKQIRIEKQEYPNKHMVDAVAEKLKDFFPEFRESE